MSKRKKELFRKRIMPPRAANKKPGESRGFYAGCLTKGEKRRLPAARQVKGLDEEIAMLRVKVSHLMAKRPNDIDGLAKTMRLLLRAMNTKQRVSPQSEDELLKNLSGVVSSIGGMVLPETMKGGEEAGKERGNS